MPDPKVGKSKDGRVMHYSAGAIIRRNGKILMEDRMKEPFGWACPCGHVDEGETAEQAVDREIWEETGLKITRKKLIHQEEVPWHFCRRGIQVHYDFVYEADVVGTELKESEEWHSLKWFTPQEIEKLTLEPIWEYYLSKLGIIKTKKKFK